MPSFASVKSVASAINPPAFVKYYPLTNSIENPTSAQWITQTTPPATLKFISRKGFVTRRNDPITNMNSMFRDVNTFNDPDISSWDVSSVTDMDDMFNNATAFNQDLTGWDVSNVTTRTDFSLNTNSSWTLRPIRQTTINRTITLASNNLFNESSSLTRWSGTHQLASVSEIGSNSIDDIISLQLTGTDFITPETNSISWTGDIRHIDNVTIQNWFSINNLQDYTEITPYSGDILQCLHFREDTQTFNIRANLFTYGLFAYSYFDPGRNQQVFIYQYPAYEFRFHLTLVSIVIF